MPGGSIPFSHPTTSPTNIGGALVAEGSRTLLMPCRRRRGRQTDRQTERERERKTERQRDRETDRDTHRQTETDRDGETDRARQRQTNRKQNEAQRNKLQSKPVSMQASKQTNMHACMYTSVHACIHTFLQARIQARKNLHTHVSARTQIHIQSLGSRQKHLPTQQRRPGLEPETSLVNAAAAAYTRGLTGAFEEPRFVLQCLLLRSSREEKG